MTDNRKLLESAAKACGIELLPFDALGELWVAETDELSRPWNPLHSSADCAAMCAKLMIDTVWFAFYVECCGACRDFVCTKNAEYADHNNDRESAWRFTATQVAAAIGEGK